MDVTAKEKELKLEVVDNENGEEYEVVDMKEHELNEKYLGHPQQEIKHEVVAAYNEVLRKIKIMKRSNIEAGDESDVEEEAVSFVEERIVETACNESPENLVKNLTDLKLFISKSLDEVKNKLLPEYEKFHMIRQAITFSEKELSELYDIKVNVNTLSAILLAQKEKTAAFEQELYERHRALENEMAQSQRERQQEENEYKLKREQTRKMEQEQQDAARRELEHELHTKRVEFEEEFESREARIAAREQEHQKLKQREAMITAREQEYQQLKARAMRYPEDLRNSVQRAEQAITEQLTRKYEYDARLLQIELESERKLYQQKISALEEQIEQYKNLKQMFNQAPPANTATTSLIVDDTDGAM